MSNSTWPINGVSDEVREKIKDQAIERGLTIAEYLEYVFNRDEADFMQYTSRPIFSKVYRVRLPQGDMEKLRAKAKQSGYGLNVYLSKIANNEL